MIFPSNVSIEKGILIEKFHIVKNRIIFSLNKKDIDNNLFKNEKEFIVFLILKKGNFIITKMKGYLTSKTVSGKNYFFYNLKFKDKEETNKVVEIMRNIFNNEKGKNLEDFKAEVESVLIKFHDGNYQKE